MSELDSSAETSVASLHAVLHLPTAAVMLPLRPAIVVVPLPLPIAVVLMAQLWLPMVAVAVRRKPSLVR